MSTIKGIAIKGLAKKFDGTAVDYVSIFNWEDGKCLAQAVPDIVGNWSFEYNHNINVGITYVADGCEPITHGAYNLEYYYEPPAGAILDYSFNGNAQDASGNNLHGVVAAGNVQYVAGRKSGTQCVKFDNGVIKTPAILPITGDKLSICFWMKTSQKEVAIVYELSENHNNAANSFSGYINNGATVQDTFNNMSINSGIQKHYTAAPIGTFNQWQHIVATIDRSLPIADEMKTYINGVESSFDISANLANDLIGNFAADVLHIGGRVSSSAKFKGELQNFRVYDRILTSEERHILLRE